MTIPWHVLVGLDAATARRLATRLGAEWRLLITDADGRLSTVVEKTYRPSRRLAEFVVARDRICRFPGCDVSARAVDLDHIVEWALGGPTTAANLQPLCRRHHRAKTFDGWSVTRNDTTGTTTWASPTGRTYQVPPAWDQDTMEPPMPSIESGEGAESAEQSACGAPGLMEPDAEDDPPPF